MKHETETKTEATTMRTITVKNTKCVNIDRIARSIERMARFDELIAADQKHATETKTETNNA